MEQEVAAAVIFTEELQESSEGTDARRPMAIMPKEGDEEDKHSQTGVDEVLRQLMDVRYNLHIMQFLKEQMQKGWRAGRVGGFVRESITASGWCT